MTNPKLIGVFWDIENCCVPRGKSAVKLVERIRTLPVFEGKSEIEFLVVCDVRRSEPEEVLDELNAAQVNVQHVSNRTRKNSADEKLRQAMRKFVDLHHSNSELSLVLISGDVDFAPDLSDFKRRKGIHTVLIHNFSAKQTLLEVASETFKFEDLTLTVPAKSVKSSPCSELLVLNLPACDETTPDDIQKRLIALVRPHSVQVAFSAQDDHESLGAVLTFSNSTVASKALKNLHGQLIGGKRMSVTFNDHPAMTGHKSISVEPTLRGEALTRNASSSKKTDNTSLIGTKHRLAISFGTGCAIDKTENRRTSRVMAFFTNRRKKSMLS